MISRMIRGFHGDNGFSLVETLVATFVFALVSASGVAILSGHENSRIRLAEADNQLTALDQTKALIRNDFFAAFDRPVRDAFGGKMVAFEAGNHMPDGTLLRLVRGGNPTAKLFGNMSSLQRVEYAVSDGFLIRRTYDRTDVVTATKFIEQQILSGVRSVFTRYATDGLWVEEWGTLPSSAALPRLAEMTITFRSGDDVKMVFLVGSGI